MHKNPYKHRSIAGSSKCSTKPLSILLTKLLTHIKQGPQKFCETSYSRSGVNQMLILKNSKELLEHLQSPNFNHITSIKSFDFSTLYTTIPHQKLKSWLATIIRNSFIHKNGNRRYKFLVLGREGPYFVKVLRATRLSSKLLGQGYVMERLKSSLRKFYGRYRDLIKHYEVSLSQMLHDILGHDHIQWHPQLIRHYTNLRAYYWTGLYYRFWPYYQILEVSIEHCNGCG